MTIPGVGQAAKRHVALDVEFAPSFVDNKVTSGQIMSNPHDHHLTDRDIIIDDDNPVDDRVTSGHSKFS